MQNILVSACLLGERVRYDGLVLPVSDRLIDALKQIANVIPFCPEVTGGLPVPRFQSEISGGGGNLVIDGKAVVNDIKGNDVTSYFITGAEKALETATKNNIRAAILKDKSPSCGSAFIYDGTFTKILKSGRGVTTALLERHGIRVFNEKDIEDALKIY
ncbi:MAG: DUF523 domain-containing protein [Proteobacteria bacterium]|nr:DUF523 domain-containing protein [Pseudomonadota bacterium]